MTMKRKRGRPPHDDILTRTEWTIVHAVQHGLTTREIAKRKGVSPDAVKFHITNAMAKLGISNRKSLRQWFQAPRQSALHNQESRMTATPELGSLAQIARTVKDIKQSEVWYRDVLGLPHLFTFGTFSFFDCGGVRLYLSQAQADAGPESILYFRVDDINRAHAELSAKGVEFLNAPHLIHRHPDGTEEWLSMFKDIEGRPLALMSQV